MNYFIPEKEIRDYLDGKLENIPVTLEILETPGPQFVTVEKTGSNVRDRLTTVTVAIQSYGRTMYEAALLNERVKELMEDLPYAVGAFQSTALNGDYNYTDTSMKRYRYQAVFDVRF